MERVFISYRHEGDPHDSRVRTLAKKLRAEKSLEVIFDAFFLEENPGGPDEGFYTWSQREMDSADKIVVVASREYERAYNREGGPGQGHGVMAEAVILHDLIEQSAHQSRKIRFVVCDDADVAFIPKGLKQLQHYRAHKEESLRELIRWLRMADHSCSVQSPPHTFLGRDKEMAEMRKYVKTPRVVPVIALVGQGGIGKSTLAYKFAEECRDLFPVQFSYDLKGYSASTVRLTGTDFMEKVVHHFRPDFGLSENISLGELQKQYRRTLETRRVLLIADNVRGDGLPADMLAMLLPPPGCFLLITSRDLIIIRGSKTVLMEEMPERDAIELLRLLSPELAHSTDESVRRIATLSGRLPLALEANAAVMQSGMYNAEVLCKRLEDNIVRLQPVEAALEISYGQLTSELQAAWRQLSVFPLSFDSTAASAVWNCCKTAAEDRMIKLLGRSLLTFDAERQRGRLHDLARLFAAQKCAEVSGERQTAEQRHAEYFSGMMRAITESYSLSSITTVEALQRFDQESVNIEAAWRWGTLVAGCKPEEEVRRLPRTTNDFPEVHFSSAEVGEVSCRVLQTYAAAASRLFILRHNARVQLGWLNCTMRVARTLKDEQTEAQAAGGLGHVLRNLSKGHLSKLFFERSLEIARKIFDKLKTRRLECDALLGRGGAKEIDASAHSLEDYQEALRIARENKDVLSEGEALVYIGSLLRNNGKADESIIWLTDALEIARSAGDQRAESAALGSLGNAHRKLGELKKAIEYYEKQLEITRKIGHRRAEGNALGNIGTAYRKLRDWDSAMNFYNKCQTIAREMEDRPAEGAALFNMAKTHKELGQIGEAVARVKEALVIKEAIDDPYTSEARERLKEWEIELLE